MRQSVRRVMCRTCMAALFILASALTAGGQSLSVTYADGDVAVRVSGTWTDLKAGDTVANDATVRIAKGGIVELKLSAATIVLSQAGTYALADILAARQKVSTNKLAAALSHSIAALSGAAAKGQNAVSGARAGDKSTDEDFEWATGDASSYIAAAKDYLDSGNSAAALVQLEQAQSEATEDEMREVSYYRAEAYALGGRTREAITALSGIQPGKNDAWAGDYALLKARLLIDTFAPQAAVDLLAGDTTGLSKNAARAPLYYFLLAVSYKQTGDAVKAQDALGRLTALAADSDLAKSAAEIVKGP